MAFARLADGFYCEAIKLISFIGRLKKLEEVASVIGLNRAKSVR